MDTSQLDAAIKARGKEFFTSIAGEAPSIFNKGWWTGKVMDWAMKNEDFKVKLFRFVDVLPYLDNGDSLSRHIDEYFVDDCGELPPVMKFGIKSAGIAGKIGGKIMAKSIRANIEKMARQFIVGQNTKEAVHSIDKLRKDGFAFVLDVLGEATVSEAEADARLEEHMELLQALGNAQSKWKPLGGNGEMDWGHAPKINLAVKPSAFYSQAKPRDFEGSVQGILDRLLPVAKKARELGAFLCIDMEQLDLKDITIELYKRLRSHPDLADYPHLGIVLQAYLRETDADAKGLVEWAREKNLPISIRLVKGAYWDYETVKAKQNGWEIPVYTVKAESDAAYERVAGYILQNADICHFACASHNIRTISAVQETALSLGVPESAYEFQVLYGMAEPVRKGLLNVAGRVRLYCPYGDLVPGMAYLVRRLLENTANESFLRQSFADESDHDRLLEKPVTTAQREAPAPEPAPSCEGVGPFRNDPAIDFTIEEARRAFPEAIAARRASLGRTYPLFIGGKDIETDDRIPSTNPANLNEVVGEVCQAGTAEIDQAIAAAVTAQKEWARRPAKERAEIIMRAAEIAKERIIDLAAIQVLEVGKQWDQAHADVGEAIDFMEYYARDMLRLDNPRRMGRAPGEINHYMYQPKGVAAVIAPWNFPLAISVGMCSAAIVTGNAVLYKPSSLSSVIGYGLVELFKEAGVPDGVFNYVPGRSSVMGDYLVNRPEIGVIAFTGSMEVGTHIIETAAKIQPGQDHVKRVIAEMGGKNALIIDDDAELDEAVVHTLYAAFGFQGQKCSACSRVIVVDAIYDRFVDRLVEGARSLKIGPSEDPGNNMGPVVDVSQQKKIKEYVEIARKEGTILVEHTAPAALDTDNACYVPMTIVGGITPEHRIAQEEIFGPVLAVMRAKNFDQAIEWANSTRYALTGGVFSRSPRHLEQARREFNVGNLYLNRNNVGALVERQAFGGFKLSGVGSKTGGPDYLIQYMDPKVVTENTMRRGFTPIAEDDEWV
ncbi:L-glutamate gamma-semialdehyde dehydrogenase [Oceanidesulfovibrio marinus]|uniref:L-glutamate gamma-semialdehyde dehydrogenase n=1 Tax=Oceanidesulfovibrio marinus TaxID=370038 RepID=A0ABX6NJI7_9BACT|nr:L-glutamate gamma-semialdehyde dehydrogenase [Oceanidesulfovibrio marinus]QJT10376.1 L-glutamate gamma-semialdehyde dehydrogenase [Oceanidesulfovibrio marinus]